MFRPKGSLTLGKQTAAVVSAAVPQKERAQRTYDDDDDQVMRLAGSKEHKTQKVSGRR